MDRLNKDDLVRWLQSALRANEHDWTCDADRDNESLLLQAIFDLALQSLSQEAVRDEAQIQAEALAQLLGAAILRLKELGETSWQLPPYAKALALKREPNAAEQVGRQLEPLLRGDVVGPAPAAPDDGLTVEQNSVGFVIKAANGNELFLTNERAAALLAKLGRGWVPVKFNMTNYPVAKHLGEWDTIDRKREDGKIFRFTLPPLPGASDE